MRRRAVRTDRRGRSLWAAVVPLVCVGAGLMFATSAQTAQGTDLRASGRTELSDVVRSENQAVDRRSASVQQLREQVDQLTAQAEPGNATAARLRRSSAALAPLAGTVAVTGPGLTVALDDAHRSAEGLPGGYTADDIVVHQQDVQSVVNALWAGGAEAMMLQDQRVVSTSAVRCVGNTLILQGRVYSPPYVVKAIGDVQGMRGSLAQDPSVRIYRQYVDLLGLGYDVQESPSLTFPAYSGSIDLEHATAAPTPARTGS